jgi:DNA-binding GntR family transcriptional regulator
MSTISSKISKLLAAQIIDGTFPPGAKLEERGLAEKFEVSRTPIREALRELGSKGLVEVMPRRGVVVARIGVAELAKLLEADCELEALCARRAAECMTAMEKKELEFIYEQSASFAHDENTVDYLINNRQFHALILTGAHNEVLAGMVADLRERLAPFRQAQAQVDDRLAVSHEEHGAIVKAILAANCEDAYNAMRSHHARLSNRVLRLIRTRQEAEA